jgi:uncharacterized membrane protein
MTLIAFISIPMSPWVWPGAVLFVTALVLLLWSFRQAARTRTPPALAWVLKLLSLLLLALCLMEPLWMGRRAKLGANLLAVLADNSRGMRIKDPGASTSRGDILRTTLENANWLATLEENFQVRRYLFDSRMRRSADFGDLNFDGPTTAIGTTLGTLAQRYQGRPLAAVLLLTDGNPTDMGEGVPEFAGLAPVYPVVVGQDRAPRDIALAHVSVSQTVFEDAPVTILAEVEATDFAGHTVVVDLSDDAGQRVERQHWTVQERDAKQVFHFRVRPDKTGKLFYQVQVGSQDEAADPNGASSQMNEATSANNQRTVVVDRGEGPYRILYVAGRPNWEYKFLRRAIMEDTQVELVALIRAAKREPKYDYRGRAGEQTNPLYRGFDPEDKVQAEQYDQPVLVRLGTKDEIELRDGFPKTAEELFKYHALVFDDVDAAFFTQDQMDLIRRFVAERGAGFLMLGGTESFREGAFARTPIAGILPVYLDRLPDGPAGPAYLSLTREGWLLPWARLRADEQEELQRLYAMPEFQVFNRVSAVKPGARVVAQVGDDQADPFPALVVQRYGQGRTAALTIGDVWRWGLGDRDLAEDRGKFWRQMLRWLVADVPERISLKTVQNAEHAAQVLTLQVQARQTDFSPMDNVRPVIEVEEPGGQTLRLSTESVPDELGLFEAQYMTHSSGAYRARAVIQDLAGHQLGEAECAWEVDLDSAEFRSLRVNRALMADIARKTGGRVLELDELDQFARSLPRRAVPITEAWIRPLWDLPGVLPILFALILISLGLEWTLRRWRGMP